MTITKVILTREQTDRYGELPHETLDSPHKAAEIIHAITKDSDREQFIVLSLNTKNQVVGIEIAHVGTVDAVHVHPREIFKAAILYNAVAIIVAHNHPSGDPTPSREDREFARRIAKAGDTLAIEVLDALVVGQHEDGRLRWVSLREEGAF